MTRVGLVGPSLNPCLLLVLGPLQPWSGTYATSNYVKYQPIIPGLNINRTNPAAPNSCLVIASGIE